MPADFYRNVLPWSIAFFIPEGSQPLAPGRVRAPGDICEISIDPEGVVAASSHRLQRDSRANRPLDWDAARLRGSRYDPFGQRRERLFRLYFDVFRFDGVRFLHSVTALRLNRVFLACASG